MMTAKAKTAAATAADAKTVSIFQAAFGHLQRMGRSMRKAEGVARRSTAATGRDRAGEFRGGRERVPAVLITLVPG